MPVPDNMEFNQAAAIPEVWLTAFQLLFLVGQSIYYTVQEPSSLAKGLLPIKRKPLASEDVQEQNIHKLCKYVHLMLELTWSFKKSQIWPE